MKGRVVRYAPNSLVSAWHRFAESCLKIRRGEDAWSTCRTWNNAMLKVEDMKLWGGLVAVLALSIVLYINFRSQSAADTAKVSVPIIEQANSLHLGRRWPLNHRTRRLTPRPSYRGHPTRIWRALFNPTFGARAERRRLQHVDHCRDADECAMTGLYKSFDDYAAKFIHSIGADAASNAG